MKGTTANEGRCKQLASELDRMALVFGRCKAIGGDFRGRRPGSWAVEKLIDTGRTKMAVAFSMAQKLSIGSAQPLIWFQVMRSFWQCRCNDRRLVGDVVPLTNERAIAIRKI
jgi:hypothetical protein